jgi:hypothetical protein
MDQPKYHDHGIGKRTSGIAMALAAFCLLSVCSVAGTAHAAQKTNTKLEAPADNSSAGAAPNLQAQPEREEHVVIVWGFRIRTTAHDLRMQSVRSGYSELVEKTVCITRVCGFVVVPDGNKWRASNVIAASEPELQEMKRNMERDGTVLVIVHPNGSKRTVPEF